MDSITYGDRYHDEGGRKAGNFHFVLDQGIPHLLKSHGRLDSRILPGTNEKIIAFA